MTTEGNPKPVVKAVGYDPRASHNAPKGRYGYHPKRFKVEGVAYEIELDHRGRAYAWQGGTMRRCGVRPTEAGYQIVGPDEHRFLVFRKDGRWYFRDLGTGNDTEL